MSAIFDRDRVNSLPGKHTSPLVARLQVSIRLGLWIDYSQWLPGDQQLDFWYHTQVLADNPITVTLTLGEHGLGPRVFDTFDTAVFACEFEDRGPEAMDLKIRISGLAQLPIRDDTGVFVCGMIEIVSVQLQEIELVHLLPDTMHGVDTEVVLPMARPVYPWLVANASQILGKKWNS